MATIFPFYPESSHHLQGFFFFFLSYFFPVNMLPLCTKHQQYLLSILWLSCPAPLGLHLVGLGDSAVAAVVLRSLSQSVSLPLG